MNPTKNAWHFALNQVHFIIKLTMKRKKSLLKVRLLFARRIVDLAEEFLNRLKFV